MVAPSGDAEPYLRLKPSDAPRFGEALSLHSGGQNSCGVYGCADFLEFTDGADWLGEEPNSIAIVADANDLPKQTPPFANIPTLIAGVCPMST